MKHCMPLFFGLLFCLSYSLQGMKQEGAEDFQRIYDYRMISDLPYVKVNPKRVEEMNKLEQRLAASGIKTNRTLSSISYCPPQPSVFERFIRLFKGQPKKYKHD